MSSGPALSSEATPQSDRSFILVVEDEFLIRLLICDELRDLGYGVVEAANAAEAIDILKSGVAVCLILSDVRMPGPIDGLGLLGFARRNFPHIPVIISSGHLPAGYAFADGATQFLPKPYLVQDALAMVTAILGSSNSNR